jgi:hypothetical protein
MTRLPMSPSAAALLRALLARADLERDRILLSEVRSTDWQSLTFKGEQHCLLLDLRGPDTKAAVARLVDGIEEAEFPVGGHILADIRADRRAMDDGSFQVRIEALTIAD